MTGGLLPDLADKLQTKKQDHLDQNIAELMANARPRLGQQRTGENLWRQSTQPHSPAETE